MNMTIIISPVYNHFLSGRIWMGIDYDFIKIHLEVKHNASVIIIIIIPFQDLKESLPNIPENSVLFYSSVQHLS